jgi:hypothetical protein
VNWTSQAWTLSQTGLGLDKVQDIVLVAKYTVGT